ncbi:MAG: DUF4124 domain-containing protein [Gammaproteobacteria bacterium]
MLTYKSILSMLLIGISLGISNIGILGEIYKWTDADGIVHFGDKPENNPASVYKVPKGNTSNVSTTNKERAEKQKKLTESLRDARRDKEEQDDKKRENIKVRKYNCRVAKDDLAKYQRASGIYDRNDVGEKVYLNEKERLREIENMKNQVNKWCS